MLLVSSTILLSSAFVSSVASSLTYQTGVNVNFTFNPKLTLTLSSNNLIIPNLAPGTSDNSNEIAITVSTNAAYGYNLSATVGNSTTYNNTDLTHTSGSTSGKFTSIPFQSNSANFISSLSSDNTWGYSIDSGTKYNGLPLYNDTTNIATLKSTDTAPSTGTDTINFLIGAKASTTQPTGDYKNVINFIAVTNPVPTLEPVACTLNKICYNENSLGPVEGTMGKQEAYSNFSVTLLASNFSREGYGFAGWSDVHDYATNPNAKFYGPQETITTPSNMSAGLSLYAVWIKSAGSMQSDATSVCNSLITAPTDGTANLSSVSALTDERDGETYAIAKLADGKCWMIENMRLADKDSSNNDIELSSTNTNNPSLPLTNNYAESTTSNHLSPSVNPTTTAWCIDTNAACYDQSMLNTDNYTNRASNPVTNTNINMYSYGAYYNWYSATAGNGKYSTSTNNSATVGDICPTGWTLPEGGDKTNMAAEKNDFYKLGLSLGLSAPANYESSTSPYWIGASEGITASTKYRSYPNNFLYSGYAYGSLIGNRGGYGYYWSKSASSNRVAYGLSFYSSSVDPQHRYKHCGYSVRCLAQ